MMTEVDAPSELCRTETDRLRCRLLIVIVSTHDTKWLNSCFESLSKSKFKNFEVLLVENGYDDAIDRYNEYHGVRVITARLQETVGFAQANNIGIEYSATNGADYVFLLNPDTIVHESALGVLVQFLDQDPSMAVAGCEQFEYGTGKWKKWNEWTREVIGEANARGRAQEISHNFHFVETDYVQGAALMFRRQLSEQVGLLDGIYGTFYEETDFCRRAQLSGSRIALVAESKVEHYGGGNWKANKSRRLKRDWLMLRNEFIFELSKPTCNRPMIAAVGIVRSQIRNVLQGQKDLTIPIWRYPGIVFSVLRSSSAIKKLWHRNQLVASKQVLPSYLRSISSREQQTSSVSSCINWREQEDGSF